MSTFFDMDCGGETVTIERTDNGDIIFHGWDEETELAAIELGFEPRPCWIVWDAINDDTLNFELLYQIHEGNTLLVEALLFVGASISTTNYIGSTPLHLAAQFGQADVASVLLKAGASTEAGDNNGWTPLHVAAASRGNVDVAKILLEAGASVDAKDDDRHTPLHEAAYRGNADVAKILLEAGASVDARTQSGETPLSIATSYSSVEVVEILEDWIAEHGK